MILSLLRLSGWVAVVAIAVLSLVPGDARPHAMASSQLEHVVAYAGTALLLAAGYGRRGQLLAIALLLPAYAGVLEILQGFLPQRTPRVIDVLAGAVGCWLGIAAAMAARRLYRGARPAGNKPQG